MRPTPPPKSLDWRRRLRRLWAAPDPDLVHAGHRGEWMVASIRLLIVVLLLYFPLRSYLAAPDEENRLLMVWYGVAALAEALVVYSAVMRSWGRGWIGFFSGIVDVSLVSVTLGLFIRLGEPLAATNDLVIFPLYLLAIGATSLRYDWRICILTGLAAVVQYASIVVTVEWLWDLSVTAGEVFGGEFSWLQQSGRLLLLGMATALATNLVVRANEQRAVANRDRLTQLSNRGFFDESLERIAALASRSGDPVTVAMIDVDHFKRFNDSHGHLAGDEALRAVAGVLAHAFRATDLVARYGGEEFAGVFPGMKADDAEVRLEHLRHAIETTPIAIDEKGGTSQVTVSIGAAVWPSDGHDLGEALAIADTRLYRAKNSGRNRVVTAGAKESPEPAAAVAKTVQGERHALV